MSYLLDKKIKRKRVLNFSLFLITLFILFYFRVGVFNNLSYIGHKIFTPFFVVGNNIGDRFGSIGAFFSSKNSLLAENVDLKSEINDANARMTNYNSLSAENDTLKDILGRKDERTMFILSAILAKPNKSPYDTLIVDVGIKDGIKIGDTVFARGNVPIGRIAEVYEDSSKVILFSNSGEKTQVVLSGKDIFLDMVGRGGGNFEMIIPRDLTLLKGEEAVLPGIVPHVVGVVETIVSDPRDPFIKALLVSPVNIQQLKFVQIKR